MPAADRFFRALALALCGGFSCSALGAEPSCPPSPQEARTLSALSSSGQFRSVAAYRGCSLRPARYRVVLPPPPAEWPSPISALGLRMDFSLPSPDSRPISAE